MLTKTQALKKAADLCARSEQCKSGVKQKLKSWGIAPLVSEEIVQQLIKEKFIDENRYTELYVKDKFNLNQWGKIKIKYMLRQKNIPDSLIDKNLQHISEQKYRQACKELMQQKAAKTKSEDRNKQKEKIFRFLSSRGFEPELIIETYYQFGKYD